MKTLNQTEAQTLYRVLKSSIDSRDVFIQLLFETGARVSETLTLSAQDLVGASLQVDPLKNSCPRQVTLSANLVAKLHRLPSSRWSEALGSEATSLPSLRRALCRHFHNLTETHLGRRLNLHSLRHTAFSRLYRVTKDLLLVKQWAGHRSVNSTMVYMALDREEEANKANSNLLESF